MQCLLRNGGVLSDSSEVYAKRLGEPPVQGAQSSCRRTALIASCDRVAPATYLTS